MVDSKRQAWPKTPGGAIDWDTVFEDEEDGLIPLITSAKSPQALRESTILVIKLLYARKDDPPEVERFVAEVTSLIPDHLPEASLPRIVEAVTAILRNIKDERVRKAVEYERQKAAEKEAEKQGRKLPPKADRRAPPSKAGADRRKMVVYGGLGLGAVAVTVAAYFIIASPGLKERLEPNMQLVEQMKTAASKGSASGANVFGGSIKVERQAGRTAVTADGIPFDACLSVSWVLLNRGTIIINGLMSQRMSPAIIKELCSRAEGPSSLTWLPKEIAKDK
jgi:hypothetical protein